MTETNGTSFHVLIEPVREGDEAIAADTLGGAIGLDSAVCEKILRKAPIALFRHLTQDDIDFLRQHLHDMKQGGLNFRITRQNVDELPKVNWPGDTNPDLRLLFGDDDDEHIGPDGDEELADEIGDIETNGHHRSAMESDTAKIPPPPPGQAMFDFSCPCCEAVFQIVKNGNADPLVTRIGPPRVNPLLAPAAPPTPTTGRPAARTSPAPAPAYVESAMQVGAAAGGLQVHGRFGRHHEEASLTGAVLDEMGIAVEPMGAEDMAELEPAEVEVEPAYAPTPTSADEFRVFGEEVVDIADPRLGDLGAVKAPVAAAPAIVEVDIEAADDFSQLETVPEDGDRINRMVQSLDGDHSAMMNDGVDEVEAVGEEEDDLEPWTGRARDYKDPEASKKKPDAKPEDDVISAEVVEDDDEEDLEPWTGRARDYRDPELATKGTAKIESEDLVSAEVVEDDEDEDTLEPWTGRARDYQDPTLASKQTAPIPAAEPESLAMADEDEEENLEPWTGRARDYKDPALAEKSSAKAPEKPSAKPAAAAKPAKPEGKPAKAKSDGRAAAKATKVEEFEIDDSPITANLNLTDDLPELKDDFDVDVAVMPKKKSGKTKDKDTGKLSKKTGKLGKKKSKKAGSARNTRRLLKMSDDELLADEVATDGDDDDPLAKLGIDINNIPDDDEGDLGDELSLDDELTLGGDDDDAPVGKKAAEVSLDDELDGDVLDDDIPSAGGGDIEDELDFGDVGGDSGGGGGTCTVFLNKVKPSDKEKAIELIAELGKMSKAEAAKLSDRLVIPVVKDVPRAQAEEVLNKFKKAGLSGRIRDGK